MRSELKPLVVTTQHRGVFFGFGIPTDAPTIRLEQARMCVYWDAQVAGVVGLAAKGPNSKCRVTGAAPSITLRDVTSVMETTLEAQESWEKEPWSR